MEEILNNFNEYKKMSFKPKWTIFTPKQKAFIKNKQISNKISALLNLIKTDPDNNDYISLLTYFVDENTPVNEIENILKCLKQYIHSHYDVIRYLFKLRELTDDFVLGYVNNLKLNIIFGEYVFIYDKDIVLFNDYGTVLGYISYLTINKFIMRGDIKSGFGKVNDGVYFNSLKILFKFITDCDSISILQKAICELLQNDKLKQFIKDALISHRAFFSNNKFYIDVLRNLSLDNEFLTNIINTYKIDDLAFFIGEIYNTEELSHLKEQTYIDFLLQTNKRDFIRFYNNKISNLKTDLISSVIYNNPISIKFYNNLTDDDSMIQLYLKNEVFKFSETFINGISFIDHKYKFNKNDIINFIERKNNKQNKKIFEIAMNIAETKCLLNKINKENLLEEYESVLNNFALNHEEVRNEIFKVLESVNPIYKEYGKIKQISKMNIKLLKIKLEELYEKVKSDEKMVDFYFDYLFFRKEVLMSFDNLKYNCKFKEKIRSMEYCSLKNDLLKKFNIKTNLGENYYDSHLQNNTLTDNNGNRNQIEEDNNEEKIQIKKENIETIKDQIESNTNEIKSQMEKEYNEPDIIINKIDPNESKNNQFHSNENKRCKIECDILYFLDNKLNIPNDYTLLKNDWTHKNKILQRLSSIIITDILEKKELRYINIINIFKDCGFLTTILKTIYSFYTSRNNPLPFSAINNLLENINFDMTDCHEMVAQLMNEEGFQIFFMKINVERMFNIFESIKNKHKYITNFIKVIKYRLNEENIEEQIFKFLSIYRLEGLKLLNELELKNNEKINEFIINNYKSTENDEILYYSLLFLKKISYNDFDPDFLFTTLFKRAKLDNIGEIILQLIKIEKLNPFYLERIHEMFFLNPSKFLDFLPLLLNEGYDLTPEMIKELIILLKNVFDNEEREKIKNLLYRADLKTHEFNMIILNDFEKTNFLSKTCLLNILENNMIYHYDIFLELVKILGNEYDNTLIIQILNLLKRNLHRNNLTLWMQNKKLERIMFRMYPLFGIEDTEYYRDLMNKFKRCDEYDVIIKFYEEELKSVIDQ